LEASRLLKLLGLTSICLVRGDDIERQLKTLKTGTHLIVGTPGRFINVMTRNKSFNLQCLGYFVIDEADRMFDLDLRLKFLELQPS
jgi:superfamily II DNA/RNA helicase